MSILIKGMEMPKSCYGCYFHEVYNYSGEEKRTCEANWDLQFDDEWAVDFKHPDCPLIEVPTPHGRLIDADDMAKDEADAYVIAQIKLAVEHKDTLMRINDIVHKKIQMLIKDTPTIIPADKDGEA